MNEFETCPPEAETLPCYEGAIASCAVATCAITETGIGGDCDTTPSTDWNCEDA